MGFRISLLKSLQIRNYFPARVARIETSQITNISKVYELHDGKPVFIASDSKQLKAAVAKYKGEVAPPYVVKISPRTKKVRKEAFMDDMTVGVVLLYDKY